MIIESSDLVIQFFLVFQKTAFEFAEDLIVLQVGGVWKSIEDSPVLIAAFLKKSFSPIGIQHRTFQFALKDLPQFIQFQFTFLHQSVKLIPNSADAKTKEKKMPDGDEKIDEKDEEKRNGEGGF